MSKNKYRGVNQVKWITIIMFIVGLSIIVSVPISYSNLNKGIPPQKYSSSNAVKNYELHLQSNVSFVISMIVDIPPDSNIGNLDIYMDKDYQSELFNREKDKIETMVVKDPDGHYRTYIRDFQMDSQLKFNDFFYNDISINLSIQYVPDYNYYPLIYILYNGSYHTFVMDEPVHISPKVLLNENEINQVKEDNNRLSNTAFQVMGIGFSSLIASSVPLRVYLDMKKLDVEEKKHFKTSEQNEKVGEEVE